MTDYLYGISLAVQTINFLFSLGFGFLSGFLYDILRIIRLSISSKKFAIVIFDLIYCILFCFLFFIFLLSVNEGQFRFYLLLGAGCGFSVYYFSLGVIIFSLSQWIIDSIKRVCKRFLSILCFPFWWILSKIKPLIGENVKKCQKSMKKIKNKSKTHLKLNKHLLYNLRVKKRVRVKDEPQERRSGKNGSFKIKSTKETE